MISGKIMNNQPCGFSFLPVMLFLLVMTANIFAGESNELEELLSPYTNIQHIKLVYHEKRFSLFLKQAKLYQGYIEYTRPDQLTKHIEGPDSLTFVIKSNQLTIYRVDAKTNQHSNTTMSLDDYPQLKQFRALFSGLLQGNAAQLTAYYHYEIDTMADNKTRLRLKSRISDPFTQSSEQPANISRNIEIIFTGQTITTINMSGFGGEKSELNIDKVIEKVIDKSIKNSISKHESNF